MTDEEIASRLSQCTLGAERGAFTAGTIFGDWRLTAFISRGGTAEVYAAEHVTLGTPAAVKILLGTDPGKILRHWSRWLLPTAIIPRSSGSAFRP